MATCEKCGHDFFFVKIDGKWFPYEMTGETFKTTQRSVEGHLGLTIKAVVQLHQCRREWIREFERRLQVECPKCGAAPGEFCIAMSGRYPRPTLKTLLHEGR